MVSKYLESCERNPYLIQKEKIPKQINEILLDLAIKELSFKGLQS